MVKANQRAAARARRHPPMYSAMAVVAGVLIGSSTAPAAAPELVGVVHRIGDLRRDYGDPRALQAEVLWLAETQNISPWAAGRLIQRQLNRGRRPQLRYTPDRADRPVQPVVGAESAEWTETYAAFLDAVTPPSYDRDRVARFFAARMEGPGRSVRVCAAEAGLTPSQGDYLISRAKALAPRMLG